MVDGLGFRMYLGAVGVSEGYPWLPGSDHEGGLAIKSDPENGLFSLGIYPNHRARFAAFIERLLPHCNLSHGGPSVGGGYGSVIGQAHAGPRFHGRHGSACIQREFRGPRPVEPERGYGFSHYHFLL